jgi:hypothetical protein
VSTKRTPLNRRRRISAQAVHAFKRCMELEDAGCEGSAEYRAAVETLGDAIEQKPWEYIPTVFRDKGDAPPADWSADQKERWYDQRERYRELCRRSGYTAE